jgi:hypothetical protein
MMGDISNKNTSVVFDVTVTSQHSTAQHNTTQHNTAQHNTAQHNTKQHNTTQHNTTQHNTLNGWGFTATVVYTSKRESEKTDD